MVTEKEKQEYKEYVEKITPTHSLPKNMAKAFLVGGLICVLGQILTNWGQSMGLDEKMSGSFCSVLLVLLSTLLTALNIWPYIGKFGGAGALVPITGFANSRVSDRRSGIWHRCQNLYHCRAGNSVRHPDILGAGLLLLDVAFVDGIKTGKHDSAVSKPHQRRRFHGFENRICEGTEQRQIVKIK